MCSYNKSNGYKFSSKFQLEDNFEVIMGQSCCQIFTFTSCIKAFYLYLHQVFLLFVFVLLYKILTSPQRLDSFILCINCCGYKICLLAMAQKVEKSELLGLLRILIISKTFI